MSRYCALVVLLLSTNCYADGFFIRWQAPTENVDGTFLTDLAGYRVYYGLTQEAAEASSGLEFPYPDLTSVSVGTSTTPGTQYYVYMTAYNILGEESSLSNGVIKRSKDIMGPDEGIIDSIRCDPLCVIR